MVREMCKSSMEGRVSIFSLPREILRVIFEYLPLPDLGILDIALVNRKLRSIYLTALDGLIIPRYESSSREIGENIFLNWLIKRKIIAIQIILYSFHAKILQFIRNCRNKIKFLSNYGCSLSAQFLCEVSPFPSLNEIILNNYNIYSLDLLGQFLRLNPQLQSIRLLHQLTPKFINTISYCCPNVKYLDFSGNRWFDDTCIVELVQGNLNNLISLNIADTGVKQDVSIQLILDTYPNLHFFSFFGCTDSSILYRSCLHQVVSPALNSMNWEMQILGLDYMSKLTETQVEDDLEQDIVDLMIIPTIIQHLIHHRQEIRCRASFVIKRHSKLVNKLGFILDLYQLSLTHQHNRELFDSLVLSYSHDYHSFPCEMHSFRHLVSWISVIFNQRSYHKESGTRYLELFSYLIRKANLLPLLQESQILTSSMQHDLNNQTIYFLSCFLSLTKHCISKYHHDYLHYLIDIGLLKYFNAAIIITTRDTMLSHESRSMKLLYNKIIRNLQRLIKSNFQYKTVILQMNFPSDIKTILMISIDEMT